MADDPKRDHARPGAEPGPAADWDQASIADQIAASARAPERRREGKRRRRRQHQNSSGWEESSGGAAQQPADSKDAAIDQLSAALWSERSGGSGATRRHRTEHRRRRSGSRWLPWAAGAGAVGLLGLAAWAGVATLKKPPPPSPVSAAPTSRTPPGAQPQPEDAPPPADMLEGLEIIDSSHQVFERVTRVITGFVTAGSAEERLGFLRPTPSVGQHLAETSHLPLLSLGLEPQFGEKFIKSGQFVYAEVIEASIGPRGAIVEDTPDGLLLDLDSFVGYTEADWGAIASGDIDGPVTTRLLAKIAPDARTESDADSLFVLEDPTQSTRAKALLELMAIDDPRLRTILQSGINLPYIFELSPAPATEGDRPELRITRVVTTGWFAEAIFPWTKSW